MSSRTPSILNPYGLWSLDGDAVIVGKLTIEGDILPTGANQNLGSPENRWQNVYTMDLHLANDRGNWTVIEEENYLTLRNNKNGKRYKLVMEELPEDGD